MSLLTAKVGIVGATGVVGEELLQLFAENQIRPSQLRLFASAQSAGRSLVYAGQSIVIEEAKSGVFSDLDLVFFCASSELAQQLVPEVVRQGAVCIDNSSAFRQDPQIPLVIPEINPEAVKNHQGIIANPNCSTIIMLMPLFAWHRRWQLKRIVVSTYQAASGAGLAAMQELKQQTREVLEGQMPGSRIFKYPIAFNLFSHDSDIADNGYCGEENKMILESRKILKAPTLEIVPTTIRVPVLRAHSESITVTFAKPPNETEAIELLQQTPGIEMIDQREANRFPMPLDASGRNSVMVGRVRPDVPGGHGLCLMVVGDQIRKGAALNALQIAQLL